MAAMSKGDLRQFDATVLPEANGCLLFVVAAAICNEWRVLFGRRVVA
jgi:hypothetical protein